MPYVQNINGLPLMPCSEAKARHLLEEHRAVIVNHTPFTIRLNFVVDDITKPVTLGVDAGYKTIGLSATTETKVLFEAEVENRPDNLITLCKTCHDKYHAGKIKLSNAKPKTGFRGAAFMTSSRWALVDRLKAEYGDDKVNVTYGYITKCARENAGLEKTHCIDARCISSNPNAEPNGRVYQIVKHRSHNRKLFKTLTTKGGIRKRNQSDRIVHGFRLFDKVICNGERGYIHGKRTSGYFHVKRFDGTDVSKGISYKKLTFVECSRNLDIF